MEYARVPDLALETNTYPRIDVIDVICREVTIKTFLKPDPIIGIFRITHSKGKYDDVVIGVKG